MVMMGIGVAGVVDGTEAPCATSLVRTHRGKTIRLHSNRTTEVSQDDLTRANSTLLTEFGWKRIVEERTGEKEGTESAITFELEQFWGLDGDDIEDEALWVTKRAVITSSDEQTIMHLRKSIRNQTAPSFVIRDEMRMNDYYDIIRQIRTAYNPKKAIKVLGMQGLQNGSGAPVPHMFVLENYVIDAFVGYTNGPLQCIQDSDFTLDKDEFKRVSNCDLAEYPKIHTLGNDFDQYYNGGSWQHKRNRLRVLHNYIGMTLETFECTQPAKEFDPGSAPCVLWGQAIAWAGLAFEEWHNLVGEFCLLVFQSDHANTGKTTAAKAIYGSVGGGVGNMCGSGTTIPGFKDRNNAMSGMLCCYDEFPSNGCRSDPRGTGDKWKECLLGVFNATSDVKYGHQRKPKGGVLLTMNLELFTEDEPFQTRSMHMRFKSLKNNGDAVLQKEFNHAAGDLSCLIPDILGIRHEGQLDVVYLEELGQLIAQYIVGLGSRIVNNFKAPMYYLLLTLQVMKRGYEGQLANNNIGHLSWEWWIDHMVFEYMQVQVQQYHDRARATATWTKFLHLFSEVLLSQDVNSKKSLHHHNYRVLERNFDGGSVVVGASVQFYAIVLTDVLKVLKHYRPDETKYFGTASTFKTSIPDWFNDEPYFFQSGRDLFWGGGLPIVHTVTTGSGEDVRDSLTVAMRWEDISHDASSLMMKECFMFRSDLLDKCSVVTAPTPPDYKIATIIRDGERVCLYDELTDGTWGGYRAFDVEDLFRQGNGDQDEDDEDDDPPSQQRRKNTSSASSSSDNDDDDGDNGHQKENTDPQPRKKRPLNVMQELARVSNSDARHDHRVGLNLACRLNDVAHSDDDMQEDPVDDEEQQGQGSRYILDCAEEVGSDEDERPTTPDVGVCCVCKGECNPASQSCGRCARGGFYV